MRQTFTYQKLKGGYVYLTDLSDRYHLKVWGSFLLGLTTLILATLTYLSFSQVSPLAPSAKRTVLLLNLDLAALLLGAILIAQRIVTFRFHPHKANAGSRLHARLVRWFGLLLVTPAIIITLFSAVFFNLGIESWFSKRVKTALVNSSEVAEAYLQEHQKLISADITALAREIAEELPVLMSNPELFNNFINRQAELRSLTEAIVFNSSPQILARSRLTFALIFQKLSDLDLEKTQNQGVVLFQSEAKDRVRALVQIDPALDIYLLVGRLVDPHVLEKISQTESAMHEYTTLESLRVDFEIKFILIFIIVALLLLLLVVWLGITFANRLARPIGALIEAAESIGQGVLSVRVKVEDEKDELGVLSQTFNRMATQLESQTLQLIEVNQQIDQRRKFIETVLSGVSAGVISLETDKKVIIANESAARLLEIPLSQMKGRPIEEIFPEVAALFVNKSKIHEPTQVDITRAGHTYTLRVQITKEHQGRDIVGYIVTFDDITELLSAQRKAAWADVARRIAHEIKNPLTPIQLSAERLKSKLLTHLKNQEDSEFLQRYIETIIRQVAYIGEMVKEFSEFSRMPTPTLQKQNLFELCEQALFMPKTAYPTIAFSLHSSEQQPYWIQADSAQIGRALTNLIQNSIDSIDKKYQIDQNFKGEIRISLKVEKDHVVVKIEDNGIGLPKEGRERLTEPYVTHKEKGTGLGLAIVKRIIEDHEGRLVLQDHPKGGACVFLYFPRARRSE